MKLILGVIFAVGAIIASLEAEDTAFLAGLILATYFFILHEIEKLK